MTVENKEPGAFDALLGELDVMAKAMPEIAPELSDEDKLKAQAEAEAKAKEGDAGPMAKSLQVTLADGTVVDAEDGTELVKSLMEQVSGLEGVMAKALGAAVGLIKKQGEQLVATDTLVKSLQAKVTELSGEGRGRKTMVTVMDKPGQLAKSETPGMTAPEFMAKSHAAFNAGKINGTELTIIDVSLRQGALPDAGLISKVMA